MENVEKNMLIGAFATGAVDAGLEGYYAYNDGIGTPLRGQFPYIEISPYIPPVDDLLAMAGVPLVLYLLGKGMKNEALVQMAKGGGIYGASALIGQTMFLVVTQTQPPAPAGRYIVVR